MATLIYGGLGHVGSWVATLLARRGEEVIIFDAAAHRFDSLGLDYLEEHRDLLTLETVDILDVHTLFEKVNAHRDRISRSVYGVAMIAGPNFQKRPFRNVSINTVGLLNALEMQRIFGFGAMVNLSSGAVYGDQPGGQTEETPMKATDLYGATKIANEVLASQYGATYGFDVRNARLYFVYGPGKQPAHMHALYQAMFGPLAGLHDIHAPFGGDQSLDWTHVEDTAAGIVALLEAPDLQGISVNISCGVSNAHRDIIDRVSRHLGHGSGMTLGAGDFVPRGAPLDIGLAREKLGFEPRFADIDEGIADYHAWLSRFAAN